MTTTGIGNNLRHKKVYRFLWLHNNERSKYIVKCSKNSCAALLVKIIEKYLRCRKSSSQIFFKVRVLKKTLQHCNFSKKRLQHQGFPEKFAKFFYRRPPVLIFGVTFERNSLLVYVLELLTIKIQTGAYFNEVLLVTDCSKSAKKILSILNSIISRLLWNIGIDIGIVNFFRYLVGYFGGTHWEVY